MKHVESQLQLRYDFNQERLNESKAKFNDAYESFLASGSEEEVRAKSGVNR